MQVRSTCQSDTTTLGRALASHPRDSADQLNTSLSISSRSNVTRTRKVCDGTVYLRQCLLFRWRHTSFQPTRLAVSCGAGRGSTDTYLPTICRCPERSIAWTHGAANVCLALRTQLMTTRLGRSQVSVWRLALLRTTAARDLGIHRHAAAEAWGEDLRHLLDALQASSPESFPAKGAEPFLDPLLPLLPSCWGSDCRSTIPP